MQHVSSAVAVTKGKERTTFIIAIDTSGMRGTCALVMYVCTGVNAVMHLC